MICAKANAMKITAGVRNIQNQDGGIVLDIRQGQMFLSQPGRFTDSVSSPSWNRRATHRGTHQSGIQHLNRHGKSRRTGVS